jgi:hypothetical protein
MLILVLGMCLVLTLVSTLVAKDLTPEIVVTYYQPCTNFTPVSILVGHIPASHHTQISLE